jgi:hypothetical protein
VPLGLRPSNPRSRECGSSRRRQRQKIGAGEGIRTLDPNLGKVVLYP